MARLDPHDLTQNEIAILGLLAEKPAYGYEIDKMIESQGMRGWADIAFSSIYAVLTGLEKKELITGATEIAGNRARKRYSLTREGKRIARQAVKNLLADTLDSEDPVMLALANNLLLADADFLEALRLRLTGLMDRKSELEDKMIQAPQTRGRVDLNERAIAKLRFEVRFTEDLIKKLAGPSLADAAASTAAAESAPVEPEPAAIHDPLVEPANAGELTEEPEAIPAIAPEPKPERPAFMDEEPKDTLF